MRRIVLLAPVLAILLAGPAVAEEIIHFTNGSQMPIRGHSVDDEEQMIHVDLGDNAFMAFPFEKVERIAKAGKNVFLQPSSLKSNKMIKVNPVRGAAPVRGDRSANRRAWERARTHGADNESHRVETDPDSGLASYRPYSYSNQRGKSKVRVVGNQAVLGGPTARNPSEGVTGTRPVGGNHQLPGVDTPRMYQGDNQLVGITFNGNQNQDAGGGQRRDDGGQRTGEAAPPAGDQQGEGDSGGGSSDGDGQP